MKKLLALFLFVLLIGCSGSEKNKLMDEINQAIEAGNFTDATDKIDLLIVDYSLSSDEIDAYLNKKDLMHRVMLDFNKSETDIVDWIQENQNFIPTAELLAEWEADNSLEFKWIDGEKRYFRNAAPNLFRVNAAVREIAGVSNPKSDLPRDKLLIDALSKKEQSENDFMFWLPAQKVKAKYTLTVKTDNLVEGELVRVWLPFPRKDIVRQSGVELIAVSQNDYILSNDKTEHNSIYMEQRVVSDVPLNFSVEYEFVSQGQWFDLDKMEIKPYNTQSADYKKYTTERTPHVVFTDTLKTITDLVTAGDSNPIEILKSCFRHIAANYPWASALEYSTIPNISQYAIDHQKGDCGQVALLLITMLRYKGIPARWQSGWMVHPGDVNLHDWLEVYFENIGWIPVDISFGRGEKMNHPIGRDFFMSGIDSYRLYINSDYSGKFYPEKKFLRSETVDFQRGEVETETRNLYFDEWSYRMEIEYLN